jgi:hypothetical protein
VEANNGEVRLAKEFRDSSQLIQDTIIVVLIDEYAVSAFIMISFAGFSVDSILPMTCAVTLYFSAIWIISSSRPFSTMILNPTPMLNVSYIFFHEILPSLRISLNIGLGSGRLSLTYLIPLLIFASPPRCYGTWP